jgi:general secretion pathway protein A
MYEAFYNFSERPFNLTPDPKYLFLSERHREALAHLLYGISQRCGFILLTGEVGTGKTTLCRALLHSLDDDTEIALIFNPNLSAVELLQVVNREFGLPGLSESRKVLVDELNAHLLERRRAGKNLVLLVDEAQNLVPSVLEELRLLSNLETETEKLLQIVLIGQPELKELLARPELRQLDQRMSVRYHLDTLNLNETAAYIDHRLHVATDSPRVRFTGPGVRRLYRFSHGAPRLINILADRALLVGFTRSRRRISRGVIGRAVREVRGGGWPRRLRAWAWGIAAAFVLAGGVALAWPPARQAVMQAAVEPAQALLEKSPWGGAWEAGESGVRKVRVVTPSAMSLIPEDELPSGPSSGLLLDRLAELDTRRSWVSSVNAILERWNGRFVSGSEVAHDVQVAAARSGLRCTRLILSLPELTRLNLPVLLTLEVPGIGTRYLALLEHEEGQFKTQLGETLRIPESEIRPLWTGEAQLFWKDHESLEEILKAGDEGSGVIWLKNALAELGYYHGGATPSFDLDLEVSVAALQNAHGLDADGIVGEQTKMVLYSALDAYSTPRLDLTP